MKIDIYTSNASSSQTSTSLQKIQQIQQDVTPIIRDLLKRTSDTLNINGTNEELEAAMRAETQARGIQSPWLEKNVHLAANLIELAFHECTFEEKRNIAIFNWCIIYIDDASTKNVAPFAAFQQRFLRGLPQLDPVLDMFASILVAMCDQYETLSANFILSATFEFINATCVEPAIEALPILPGAVRFPSFLRDRTGLGVPYALMAFPNSRPLGFVTCFQTLPDMNFWIAAINDILSFYKERLAGETVNYIFNRAHVENKAPLQVLSDMRDELVEASNNVVAALTKSGAPGAAEVWKSFERGVIAWHLGQDRYKLKDLDI